MTKGEIVLVEVDRGRMYLRLAGEIEYGELGVRIPFDKRMDVQIVPSKDPRTGAPMMDTMMLNVGDTLEISKTEPSMLIVPRNVILTIAPVNKSSSTYRDLISSFSGISLQ